FPAHWVSGLRFNVCHQLTTTLQEAEGLEIQEERLRAKVEPRLWQGLERTPKSHVAPTSYQYD
ncbi:Hypothetical predicted protein, partial [Marmota monax]